MSTDFDIRCETCSRDNPAHAPHHFEAGLHEQRSPDELQALISIAREGASIGRLFKRPGFYLRDWDVFSSCAPRLFNFFAEHGDHVLSVYDEYGRPWAPVQAYENGEKVGEPKMCRIEETTPRASAVITMP